MTKFHDDSSKIEDFLLVVKFWSCPGFFESISMYLIFQKNLPIGWFSSHKSWMKWYSSSDTPTYNKTKKSENHFGHGLSKFNFSGRKVRKKWKKHNKFPPIIEERKIDIESVHVGNRGGLPERRDLTCRVWRKRGVVTLT